MPLRGHDYSLNINIIMNWWELNISITSHICSPSDLFLFQIIEEQLSINIQVEDSPSIKYYSELKIYNTQIWDQVIYFIIVWIYSLFFQRSYCTNIDAIPEEPIQLLQRAKEVSRGTERKLESGKIVHRHPNWTNKGRGPASRNGPRDHLRRIIGQVRVSVMTLKLVCETLKPLNKPNQIKDDHKPQRVSTELNQVDTIEGRSMASDDTSKLKGLDSQLKLSRTQGERSPRQ